MDFPTSKETHQDLSEIKTRFGSQSEYANSKSLVGTQFLLSWKNWKPSKKIYSIFAPKKNIPFYFIPTLHLQQLNSMPYNLIYQQ